MSDITNRIISTEKPQQCDSCGESRELRPYGPPGKTMICGPCATATPEIEAVCRANFFRLMDGTPR